MNVREIFIQVFEEYAREKTGDVYEMIATTDVGGALLLTERHCQQEGNLRLCVYYSQEAYEEDRSAPLFWLEAGSMDAGHWAIGQGRLMREDLVMNGVIRSTSLIQCPAALVSVLIQSRVARLVLENYDTLQLAPYWEVLRDPNGNFETYNPR